MAQWKVTIFRGGQNYSGRLVLLYNGKRGSQSFDAESRAEMRSWLDAFAEAVEDAERAEAAAAALPTGVGVTSGRINTQGGGRG